MLRVESLKGSEVCGAIMEQRKSFRPFKRVENSFTIPVGFLSVITRVIRSKIRYFLDIFTKFKIILTFS